jgi:hypothetical protein
VLFTIEGLLVDIGVFRDIFLGNENHFHIVFLGTVFPFNTASANWTPFLPISTISNTTLMVISPAAIVFKASALPSVP